MNVKLITCVLVCLLAPTSPASAQQLQPNFEDQDVENVSVSIKQIQNLTEVAKTVGDFKRIAERGEKLLQTSSLEKDKKYLNSLIAWSLNRAAQLHAKTSASMAEVGLIEQSAEELGKAIKEFDVVIERYPSTWRAWMGRAKIHAQQGQYDEALAKFIEVTKRKRDQHSARFNCAEILRFQGEFENAITYYSRMISEDASDVQALNGRAHCFYALTQYEQAVGDYRTVVRLQPADENALCNLGDAYGKAGDWEQAFKVLDPASELPGANLAMERLANLLLNSPEESKYRDARRAVTLAKSAVEAKPANPKFLRTLAAAYAADQQSVLAMETKLRATKLEASTVREAKATSTIK